MADCVFCMIRDGQIPSAKVYDDERTLAFMDINPLTRGHCLVATRAHAATLYDVEPEDLRAAIATAKKVAGAIRRALNPDGLNMLRNASTDSLDVRIYYYAQVGCTAPGWNGQVKLR